LQSISELSWFGFTQTPCTAQPLLLAKATVVGNGRRRKERRERKGRGNDEKVLERVATTLTLFGTDHHW